MVIHGKDVTPDTAAGPIRELGYVSQVLQRAIDVLEVVSEAPEGCTLTELSAVLGIPKSSALRLLANLELRGLVEQDQLRRFRLGMRMFTLGSRWLGHSQLRGYTRPHLEELSHKTGENTCMAILDQDQVFYLDRIEPSRPARSVPLIGSHQPLHATAVGKVLLANLPKQVAAQMLARREMQAVTAKTVTDRRVLERQLPMVAKRDCAVEVGEFQEGLTCLGVPIRDGLGTVVAALGLSGPSWRLSQERTNEAISLMRAAAAQISDQLGRQPTREEIGVFRRS